MSLLLSVTALFGGQVEALVSRKMLLRQDASSGLSFWGMFKDGNSSLGKKVEMIHSAFIRSSTQSPGPLLGKTTLSLILSDLSCSRGSVSP